MAVAIDSNILIDLLGEVTVFSAGSIEALDAARLDGSLVICPVVAAEISGYFPRPQDLDRTLAAMQIALSDFRLEDVHLAGTAFVRYRQRSRLPKDRMLADFLIGAHAQHHAGVLLTRDRGYYRTYFPKLKVIAPLAP